MFSSIFSYVIVFIYVYIFIYVLFFQTTLQWSLNKLKLVKKNEPNSFFYNSISNLMPILKTEIFMKKMEAMYIYEVNMEPPFTI